MAVLHVQLLGGLRLVHGEKPVAGVCSARAQGLLAYLTLHAGALHPRTHLAGMFWPDSTEEQARTNLRKLLHELRHTLPEADRCLAVSAAAIGWRLDAPFRLDVAEFEQKSAARTVNDLEAAVGIYGGDLLPGCYDEWIGPERERLRQAFLAALTHLVCALAEAREWAAAAGHAERLLRHDPLCEEMYRDLMALYMQKGDRASALRTYHACAEALRRELGAEPSPATRAAYARLLRDDAAPAATAPVPFSAAPQLVGRLAEWGLLQSVWRRMAAGQPGVVLIRGESGIGKTRLAGEFLRWAARQGIATARACCYPLDNRLALAPVAAWLRGLPPAPLDRLWRTEVARLLPELLVREPSLPPPGPLAESWQRGRLFEALARALLGHRPLVLLLDDIQWCDPDTLEWLHYLLQFDASASVCVIGTLNPEYLGPGHPAAALQATLQRWEQLTEIALGPLLPAETAAMAASITGQGVDQAEGARIHRETGGNPLLILELARAGLPAGHAGQGGPFPEAIRTIVADRLDRLSDVGRRLALLAAALGPEIPLRVLARAAGGEDEALVTALDELWQRGFLRESAPGTYAFTHEQVRAVVYAQLSPARRTLLHRQVVDALAAVHAGNLDAVSGLLALHAEHGGLPELAGRYHARAGDAARRLYANEAALQSYRQAQALLPEAEIPPVLCSQGEVWRRIGRLDEAESAFRRALILAEQTGGGSEQARCRLALGELLVGNGAYAEALACLEKAKAAYAAVGNPVGGSRVLGAIGRAYQQMGDYSRALTCHEQQLATATEHHDQSAMALALGRLGRVYWVQRDYPRVLQCYGHQLEIATRIGDMELVGNALAHHSVVHWAMGDDARAVEYALQGLSTAESIGDRRNAGFCMTLFGVYYAAYGEPERAFAWLFVAVPMLLDVGNWLLATIAFTAMSHVYASAGNFPAAERVLARAIALCEAYDAPYWLSEPLLQRARNYVALERYEEALGVALEALDVATRVGRPDIQFEAQLLQIRLEATLGRKRPAATEQALTALLAQWPEERAQSAIRFALWQLEPSCEEHRRTAAALYRTVCARSPRAEFRRRYRDLTDADPPVTASLPEVPAVSSAAPHDLEALLARVDGFAANGGALATWASDPSR